MKRERIGVICLVVGLVLLGSFVVQYTARGNEVQVTEPTQVSKIVVRAFWEGTENPYRDGLSCEVYFYRGGGEWVYAGEGTTNYVGEVVISVKTPRDKAIIAVSLEPNGPGEVVGDAVRRIELPYSGKVVVFVK